MYSHSLVGLGCDQFYGIICLVYFVLTLGWAILSLIRQRNILQIQVPRQDAHCHTHPLALVPVEGGESR